MRDRTFAFGVLAAAFCLALPAAPSVAEPVYKDAERFGPDDRRPPRPALLEETEVRRVLRPLNGGPGYAGSDYGLGKPAYTGLGSRPDWGRGGD